MQEILRVGGNVSSYGGFIMLDNFKDAVNKSVSEMPIMSHPLKLQAYALMVCTQGYFEYRLDYDKPLYVNAGELFFFQYGQIIEFISAASNTKMFIITISKENMINLLHFVPKDIIPQSQPLKLTDDIINEIQVYYNLMRNYIGLSSSSIQEDVLRANMFIILMRLGCLWNQQYSDSKKVDTSGNRKMEIYHRFVNEVKENFKKHRDVEFYASSLFMSSGHLSRIIKAISGKTVGGWIRDYVILEAKVMLQTSDLTISQISDYLNFPNPSFFSKYFRESTGLTPGQYRKSYKS